MFECTGDGSSPRWNLIPSSIPLFLSFSPLFFSTTAVCQIFVSFFLFLLPLLPLSLVLKIISPFLLLLPSPSSFSFAVGICQKLSFHPPFLFFFLFFLLLLFFFLPSPSLSPPPPPPAKTFSPSSSCSVAGVKKNFLPSDLHLLPLLLLPLLLPLLSFLFHQWR